MEDWTAILGWLGVVTVAVAMLVIGVLIGLILHTTWGTPYKKMYRELRDSTNRETPIGTANRRVKFLKDMVNGTVRKLSEGKIDLDKYHDDLKEARDELRVLLEKEQERIEAELKFVPGGE